MPLVLKSTQVNRSSMTLPSDIIQAAPLHITFNSGYVPPGFFTRFVVVLASKIELCFEKGVYRNHVTLRYQDPNSTSIEHVVVTDCTDVIQINVQHHHLDHELVSFTKICQDIHGYLEDAAKEVEELLMKCASGGTTNNKSTQYVFKHEFKYVCTSCPTTTPLHYITLPPTTSTQDSQVFCDENTNDYRVLTEQEKVWFKDTSQSTPATQMPPTATAKSPKRNNSKRRIKKGVHSHESDVKLLDISDLDYVIEELQSIDYTEWKTLGVHLGLYHTTLEAIKADHGSVKKCLMECMAAWLKKEDKVREKGGPSWLSLATALEKIGTDGIAINIRAKYCRP
ncbi:PREDICTED: uncharacterized protein LOC109584669 [Amphimedon queenslandica]|uniref:Death domain-containing protein n=2 Tax=Amphimedon queenslandica TaxID=400682 RepID=A0AAN0JG77_AMPQE|nr:PREDICTED: uncharacterized protein LOC109584669 [Amphimedon queenslandica]|eukprot:XP_019856045.1 PREDICTED: uncharacterized protein LOC109584669 [Amphimedon queenslandica]